MCNSPLHSFLQALPKCEHHLHIEGALSPSLLFKLADRNNITLPTDDPAYNSESTLLERYNHFTSLDDFLHYYYINMSVLVHPTDFEDLAMTYFHLAKEDNILHAEISFDPQVHLERGLSFTDIVTGLTAARARAEKELEMTTTLICCFQRHLPPQSALEILKSAQVQSSISAGLITAIGLDSSEKDFPPELFKEVYAAASKLGIKLTAHAGEEGPAQNIETAFSTLGVERIDHGIRLIDDPEMLHKFAKRGTLFTLCPLSNLRLKCVKHIAEVPVRRFLEEGVRFSINGDDPAYFDSFGLKNYCAVQEVFALGVEEWVGVCRVSIEGSWCGEGRKVELLEGLERVRREYVG